MIFQWEFYLDKHEDLRNNGLFSQEHAVYHWEKYGQKEQRIYHDIPIFFDWKNYIECNMDLSYIINEEEAWKHFLYYGMRENRKILHKTILKMYAIEV